MDENRDSDPRVGDGATPWNVEAFQQLSQADLLMVHAYGAVIGSVSTMLSNRDWHLKGAAALLGYVGPTARLPHDIDISVNVDCAAALLRPARLPDAPRGLNGRQAPIQLVRVEPIVFTGGRARPQVYRALISVGSDPVLTNIVMDVLVVSEADALSEHRVEALSFPAAGDPIPAATLSRCLAQKLLRYTWRRSGSRVNTRWSDLRDFLTAAASRATSGLTSAELIEDIRVEFARMERTPPPTLPEPPREWLDFWDTEMFLSGLTFGSLDEAAKRLAAFWEPVLAGPELSVRWSPKDWSWLPAPAFDGLAEGSSPIERPS